ncbi:hypothetical protein MMC12_004431 [Toensbergia leucococca]|nr:hypothetical protein [Toensbergia leucococca]
MAMNVAATQAYTSPPGSQTQLFGLQQFSPANSASGTPMDSSPTSPRNSTLLSNLPLPTRQLRPLKTPMYVPAVLRPTERPQRPSPPTPPRSIHGSIESLEDMVGANSISRRSTGDSRKKRALGVVTEDEAAVDNSPRKVMSMPTRDHWKPDFKAEVCDAPTCEKNFSLFERRHHCRHCGYVFCNAHSHYSTPLDQDAEFNSHGTQSRSCQHCWERYCRWEATRCAENYTDDIDPTNTPNTPIKAGGPGKGADGHKGSVASSIPRDWNWSTF